MGAELVEDVEEFRINFNTFNLFSSLDDEINLPPTRLHTSRMGLTLLLDNVHSCSTTDTALCRPYFYILYKS